MKLLYWDITRNIVRCRCDTPVSVVIRPYGKFEGSSLTRYSCHEFNMSAADAAAYAAAYAAADAAAAYAADAADADAKQKHYQCMRDKLLDLLRESPALLAPEA